MSSMMPNMLMRTPGAARGAITALLAVTVAGGWPGPGYGMQQPKGPPRPPNKLLVSGSIQTTERTPVVGARVVAELIRFDRTGTGDPECLPQFSAHLEAESSPTGQFEILFQSPGPQFDACLVVRVFAPAGSGLRDTTISGQRVRFELPDPHTHQVSTVHLDAVLNSR